MQKQTDKGQGGFVDKVEKWPIIFVFSIIASLCVYLVVNPDAPAAISGFRGWVVSGLCSFYLWLALGVVIFLAFFVFSKYGSIKLGGGDPEYSTFSWVVMMFCAGMGSSLLYWSCIEWIYYYSAPPLGAVPFSQYAAELSSAYPLFHWTLTAWALFTVGAVSLGYRYYVKKKPGLSLAQSCERVLGEKRVDGWLGKVINVIFIFGIFGGLSATLAFGVPMICDNLATLTGIQNGFGLKVGMIAFISLIFFISGYIGLEKGLKNLADWNAYIAIGLALFVLVVGPTVFILNATTQGLGFMLSNFIHMSLWTDSIGKSGFPEGWTAFYWAWWLALGPWMWIFEVKVSKGRTIREMILGMVGAGSLGVILYFGVISNAGLYMQLNNVVDLVAILENQGGAAAITALLHSLPFGTLIVAVWMITGIMFLATTLDSASWTLAAATTTNLGEKEEPKRSFRMFWSVMLALVPLAFIFTNADLGALQTLSVLTAVPIGILAILSMISAILYVREDFGDVSVDGIVAFNKQRDLEEAAEADAQKTIA